MTGPKPAPMWLVLGHALERVKELREANRTPQGNPEYDKWIAIAGLLEQAIARLESN